MRKTDTFLVKCSGFRVWHMSDCGMRLRKPSAEGGSGRKQDYAAPHPPEQQASVMLGAGHSMDLGPEN